jgi:hypothetical protein
VISLFKDSSKLWRCWIGVSWFSFQSFTICSFCPSHSSHLWQRRETVLRNWSAFVLCFPSKWANYLNIAQGWYRPCQAIQCFSRWLSVAWPCSSYLVCGVSLANQALWGSDWQRQVGLPCEHIVNNFTCPDMSKFRGILWRCWLRRYRRFIDSFRFQYHTSCVSFDFRYGWDAKRKHRCIMDWLAI